MKWRALLFVIPTLFFSGVLLYLVFYDLYFSFTNWSATNPSPKFVGVSTYSKIFSSTSFSNALVHSGMMALTAVLVGNLLGLVVAGLLYFIMSNRRKIAYMSVFIYPLAISMSSNALIWLWLFNPSSGINWLLASLHLPTYGWLSSPASQFPSFLLVVIWAYSGLAVIFYMAAFLNVDRSIIEAARLDGSTDFRIFRTFLLPNSLNGFIVSTALLFLFSFRVFSLSYVIGGGPTNSSYQTLVMYAYYQFYTESFAKSAAVSVIIIVIAAAVVIPYAIFGIKRWIKHA